jgi:hypothetical protein
VKIGKVLVCYKVGMQFHSKIGEGSLPWARREDSVPQEEQLDGIYVLRASESKERLRAEDAARGYKTLPEAERVFHCLKGIDLVGPIRLNFQHPFSPDLTVLSGEGSSNHKGSDALIGDRRSARQRCNPS